MANLTVSLSINPNPANLGDQITFKATANGGQAPYTFAWSGRPDVTTDTIVCTSQESGTFTVGLTVTDSLGSTANTQSQYTINQPTTDLIVSLQIDPNTITLGQQSIFAASVTGGNPPYSYQWTNLPTPCNSTNTNTISCKPNSIGDYNISVDVSDSLSATASATGQLTVNKPSQILKVQLELSHKTIKVGQKVTMRTHTSGGKKPYSYEYTGLPHPCHSDNKDHFDCRPDQKGKYNITVTVIDSNNNTGNDTHPLTVN